MKRTAFFVPMEVTCLLVLNGLVDAHISPENIATLVKNKCSSKSWPARPW